MFWTQIVSKTTGNRGLLIEGRFHTTLTCQNVSVVAGLAPTFDLRVGEKTQDPPLAYNYTMDSVTDNKHNPAKITHNYVYSVFIVSSGRCKPN